ncbi:LysR family transcriptional regulator [Rhizobium sp. BK418]|uniref:LysR family transcriptional regulator n=1 Tax=Rhizobium sp. BK418 TaxID=2512120 RepID=UPI001046FADF|nr:LysR family transcriptional regulator [Rhizobium sp. BK418]TCS09058.1 LysR family transcriptional regulator [Rhizobium sp. BK418]
MSLTHIDLNLLVTLDAVLTEGSVARAAERLHVTPSAVSNALARLRTFIGDPLVVRSGRGVVATPRGLELAPALKSALEELKRAVQSQAFDPATTTRQFTIAVSDAGQISWLPAFGRLMSSEMPRARLRIVGIDTYLSLGGPPSTEVDVAIAAIEDTAPGVHISPLRSETSVLVARRSHPSAGERITKARLSKLEHVEVQVAPGRGYRGLARLYADAGIERHVAMTVPSFVAAAAVAAETDFVATLPANLVDVFQEQFGLSVLKAPAPTLKTAVNLIWHDRTNDDPASRAFRLLIGRSFGRS